ncbi:MAG TPA: hypothetical protein VNO21_16740, partial [Polyangiaceae bacterium]|nr:hypothetical protein [Polyangiaceae bacterium]
MNAHHSARIKPSEAEETMTTTTPSTLAENDDNLERHLGAATAAHGPLARLRPAERANLLRRAADALDAAAAELISVAQRETKLAEARLKGELARTTFQLR